MISGFQLINRSIGVASYGARAPPPASSALELARYISLAISAYTGWIIENVPNFAMMLYYSAVEFKQKEITFLKSNHS